MGSFALPSSLPPVSLLNILTWPAEFPSWLVNNLVLNISSLWLMRGCLPSAHSQPLATHIIYSARVQIFTFRSNRKVREHLLLVEMVSDQNPGSKHPQTLGRRSSDEGWVAPCGTTSEGLEIHSWIWNLWFWPNSSSSLLLKCSTEFRSICSVKLIKPKLKDWLKPFSLLWYITTKDAGKSPKAFRDPLGRRDLTAQGHLFKGPRSTYVQIILCKTHLRTYQLHIHYLPVCMYFSTNQRPFSCNNILWF